MFLANNGPWYLKNKRFSLNVCRSRKFADSYQEPWLRYFLNCQLPHKIVVLRCCQQIYRFIFPIVVKTARNYRFANVAVIKIWMHWFICFSMKFYTRWKSQPTGMATKLNTKYNRMVNTGLSEWANFQIFPIHWNC